MLMNNKCIKIQYILSILNLLNDAKSLNFKIEILKSDLS